MSGRYKDYKGSSRSARDDSRPHKERNRSRSPRRTPSPPPLPPSRSRGASSPSPPKPTFDSRDRERQQRNRQDDRNKRTDWDSSEEEVPAPPPPPRISKISMGFSKPGTAPIKMNLGGTVKAPPKKPLVASVFNDDDDEPEEMPAEAKMRMRNIGRETPTSAGPNSFGKTKHGFCDSKKVFEKNLKIAFEMVDKKGNSKFPQTIYKISDSTK